MNPINRIPTVIQGGMGAGISNGRLARAVFICLNLFLRDPFSMKTYFGTLPTGYPLKKFVTSGTTIKMQFPFGKGRECDWGCPRTINAKDDGALSYYCPDTAPDSNTFCCCDGLMSAAGRPKNRTDEKEPPVLTSVEKHADVGALASMITNYTAEDVLDFIRGNLNMGPTA